MASSFFDEIRGEQHENALRRFSEVCNEWKSGNTMTILLEGAGDVFRERYWPFLKPMTKTTGKARITVTDLWAESKQPRIYPELVRSGVDFLNKKKIQDFETYRRLDPQVVLILVPDAQHLRTVGDWIGEESWIGRSKAIFVEKPYDRYYHNADHFQQLFASKRTSTLCFSFDHYLSKIVDFVPEAQHYVDLIGGEVNRIQFTMLENQKVEVNRAGSVGGGMIFDMLCHMLAIAAVVADLGTLRFTQVLPARHKACAIKRRNAETFADVTFLVKNRKGNKATGTGSVGKGVGKKEEKFILLEGEAGEIQMDLSGARKIRVFCDEKKVKECEVRDGYDNFLEVLFAGDYLKCPVGALPHKTSIEVLKGLLQAKEIVDRLSETKRMPEYSVGESLEEIRSIAQKHWSSAS